MMSGWSLSVSKCAAKMADASALSMCCEPCTAEVHRAGKEKMANDEVCVSELPSVAIIAGCVFDGGGGIT